MYPGLHTLDTLAVALGVSHVTASRWVRAGTVPAARIGKLWRLWGPAVAERLYGPDVDIAALAAPPAPPGEPEIIGVRELAERLDIAHGTASRLVAAGAFPATARTGQTYRLHWPTIRDQIARGEDFMPLNPRPVRVQTRKTPR
ncbi:helix-turn-helix domain-containing protein [Jannaschia sp. R86511]|uniref:helix-turn-helix domain-containing protein n=1 Tax=Jannaschia sp. R86511 TaxID=3093853 RepID=UPI0036D343AF